ncbi:DUF2617 family protein [Longispora sp. NPDC051575]|uniref:DUF2617 family protein n=1 Tax=Longispora sp. NPDC051575 TaxID=3154943 RepID=UPI00341C6DFC
MITTIPVPYVDTNAAALSFTLGGPLLPALDTLFVETVDARLELRLLGASHQAILDTPAGRLIETVACLPDRSEPLPDEWVEAGYTFRSEIRVLDPWRLRHLRTKLGSTRSALVGMFPGSPDALTALFATATPDGITWRTWHSYPQTGELAVTSTTVKVPR